MKKYSDVEQAFQKIKAATVNIHQIDISLFVIELIG